MTTFDLLFDFECRRFSLVVHLVRQGSDAGGAQRGIADFTHFVLKFKFFMFLSRFLLLVWNVLVEYEILNERFVLILPK